VDDDFPDLDAFLDMDTGFDAPPPPPPIEDDEPEIFVVVENMPEMIGGQQALYSVLRYPDIARRAGIEGRVIIQFVVDEQGNVQNPIVVRSAGGGGLDEAAIEAIKRVRFTPGMQRGRPVKVQMTQPVIFRLQ
jgi:protein TonB